jgi:hypothetical protein
MNFIKLKQSRIILCCLIVWRFCAPVSVKNFLNYYLYLFLSAKTIDISSGDQGCKSIVTSLSAFAIALLSPLNIADTATDTIASVLSPLPIGLPDNSAKTNSAKPTRPDLFFMFFSGRVVRNIAKFFGQLGHHQN